jgi:apolipoprotein D and lipocalin family protein
VIFCMITTINKNTIRRGTPVALAAALAAAGIWFWQKTRVGLPKGAVPVKDFDVNRYAGLWYEIARFDYRFEKGLINVMAEYSMNEDGSIKVVNRGQDQYSGEWEQSTGKAKFVDDGQTGRLKVSFFRPFYAAYTVIGLDKDYYYALVAGNDLDYLWLLSREREMPDKVKADFLKIAAGIGYDVSRLIWTKQEAEVIEMPIATVS